MRILLTGATGLIGKELGKELVSEGHDLFVISRSLAKAREQLPFPCEVIRGDLTKEILHDERLQEVDAVINLLGEPIAGGRWNAERKKRIHDSRVIGTRNLVQSLKNAKLKVFVSGSAMGYYGDRGDELLSEDAGPGKDFLAQVCVDWENEVKILSCRKVFIRTSVVLANQGGALDKMLFPFRAGVGGPLGNGKQWMSWIHIKDIVGLFAFALNNEKVEGPLNGASPYPVRNREFSETLSRSLGRMMGPAVPVFVLKALFGEMGEVLVTSEQGDAKKALALGYRFHYEKLHDAFHDICAPFRDGEETFVTEQYVPEPPEKLFEFFRDPNNLESLTPEMLKFHIHKVSSTEIHQGTFIDYKLRVHGIPINWKSEIKDWKPPFSFIDDQLKGPYRQWTHLHEFRPFQGGTLMVDQVRYKLPMGFLGWLVASNFVRKDVENIFSFRRKYIANIKDGRK
jgi:uncharacterized protein (TIGR01777 family)